MWSSTTAERQPLASRDRTCCLRRSLPSRPLRRFGFRGSIAHPTRSLCTLRSRRRRRPRNTRYRAPATAYPSRSSTGRIAPASWRTRNPRKSKPVFLGFSWSGLGSAWADLARQAPVIASARLGYEDAPRSDAHGGSATESFTTALKCRNWPGNGVLHKIWYEPRQAPPSPERRRPSSGTTQVSETRPRNLTRKIQVARLQKTSRVGSSCGAARKLAV